MVWFIKRSYSQMKNKNYNIPSKSIPAHKMQTFITLFLVDDPTEQNDLAKSKPDIVKTLSQRLQMLTNNALPPNYPLVPDPKSDPSHFDNVWSPGWCWNFRPIIITKLLWIFDCNEKEKYVYMSVKMRAFSIC